MGSPYPFQTHTGKERRQVVSQAGTRKNIPTVLQFLSILYSNYYFYNFPLLPSQTARRARARVRISKTRWGFRRRRSCLILFINTFFYFHHSVIPLHDGNLRTFSKDVCLLILSGTRMGGKRNTQTVLATHCIPWFSLFLFFSFAVSYYVYF